MSTQMSDPRDLFLHELGDVLYAEQMLVKTLPKLQAEAADDELAQGFGEHLEETRQHVQNLEQAFAELDEPVKAEKCPGIEGIKKEHDEFVSNESPSPEVLDAFLLLAHAAFSCPIWIAASSLLCCSGVPYSRRSSVTARP